MPCLGQRSTTAPARTGIPTSALTKVPRGRYLNHGGGHYSSWIAARSERRCRVLRSDVGSRQDLTLTRSIHRSEFVESGSATHRLLDIGLVDERASPQGMATTLSGGVDQQRCEPLQPTLRRHLLHVDAAFGKEFFQISTRGGRRHQRIANTSRPAGTGTQRTLTTTGRTGQHDVTLFRHPRPTARHPPTDSASDDSEAVAESGFSFSCIDHWWRGFRVSFAAVFGVRRSPLRSRLRCECATVRR